MAHLPLDHFTKFFVEKTSFYVILSEDIPSSQRKTKACFYFFILATYNEALDHTLVLHKVVSIATYLTVSLFLQTTRMAL